MLILDATTKSIKAVMSGAQATTNPDFTAAFADNTGTVFTEGANDGAFNGTSPVTIVAAPASATRRIIKSITIENKDTAAVTITLSYDNNGTLRTIAKVTLQVGDTWTTNGTFDTNGNLKSTLGVVNLTSQVTGTLPVANGGTGITSFGTGVATFLGTPSSSNLAAAVTDETGSGALVFATSPTLVTPVLGTPASGNLESCTADGTNAVGFKTIPQNVQTGSYTLVLADSGKHIYRGSGSAATWTIPANGSVAYPVGTALTFINYSATSVSIAITTDTMRLSPAGTTGTRTLAQYGSATAVKVDSTNWIISGSGLT